MDDDASPGGIYCAIDLGTTYSAIAWSHSASPNVQTTIIQYPDAYSGTMEGVTSEKVPTQLVYNGQSYRWGFQIKDHERRHHWFKLAVNVRNNQQESELERLYPDLKAFPPPYESSPVEPEKLVTDYLTALRGHLLHILTHKLGAEVVSTTRFCFIVTVPAIWSDGAKEKTRRCAKAAGLGDNVRMISEPEAAAIHSLDMMHPHGLQIGQTFVVCDAGGGTVDLITYEIELLKPILKVREATAGNGDLCGSSFLNRIFQKHLEGRFKHLARWDEETLEEAMDKFEKITKRHFGGQDTDEFVIPVGGLRDNNHLGVRNGRYRMSGKELGKIFAPVTDMVVKLVKQQIAQSRTRPKAILLLGGFGQSSFLREQIRKAVPDIDVKQPANGWTAVVRGALTKAMAEASPGDCRVFVNSRIARKSYGIVCSALFDEDKHEAHRKVWDYCDGLYRVQCVQWLVKKGDDIKESESITAYFHRHLLVCDGPLNNYTSRFYFFTGEIPPVHKDHSVQHLVSLSVDLSPIPVARLHTVTGADGEKYYSLNYEIRLTFCSAHTDYSLWYRNQCYASVQAEYAG